MSENNNKDKHTVGIYEINQLLEVMTHEEIIRIVCSIAKLGLIELEKTIGKNNK